MKVPNSGLMIDSPAWPLLQGMISYWGITTAAGAAGGTTLICADLVNEPSYDGLTVKILSGPAAGQARTIAVHPAPSTTLTVAIAFSDAAGAPQQITAGVLFCILTSIGGGGSPGPAPEEGLTYYGVVDAVPGANQFTVAGLAGLGAGKFAGATNPYSAFVLRDAGGASAAPQGEIQPVTAYVTATGIFTTAAFTAAVAVGDEVLIIHPALATLLDGMSATIDLIFALVNAMFTLQDTGGTITTDGTEQDIYRVETPMGVFEPRKVQIDFTNQTVTESVIVRVYYRINPAGNMILKDTILYNGAQTPPLKNIELEPNRFGIRVTMQRNSGGAIAYDWAAFFRS